MLKKEANEIVGGLSAPGKMPCPSINLPAVACVTGSKLAKVPGTRAMDATLLREDTILNIQK